MPGFKWSTACLVAKVPLSASRQIPFFEGVLLRLLARLKRNGGSATGTHVLWQLSAGASAGVV